MPADDKTHAAFAALTASIAKRLEDATAPLPITLEHRTTLVAFAEANSRAQGRAPELLNKMALGRVQALYVAGSLAMLDGIGAKSPFKDAELTKVYEAEQQYMRSLHEKQQGRGDEGHTRGVER